MGNVVRGKSYQFSIKIVETCIYLSKEKKEFVLSKQLMRSGTSVGANIEEAIAASSPKDFINKLTIVQEETDETLFWLELLSELKLSADTAQLDHLMKECTEILRIITSALITLKKKRDNKS